MCRGLKSAVLQVVLCGPDSSIYSAGTFQLYLQFPSEFPALPPDVRFVTPIRHCNINSQGRVCHSILTRCAAYTHSNTLPAPCQPSPHFAADS